MYNISRTDYRVYYENYINGNIREFQLECDIAPPKAISSVTIEYDLLSGAEEYCIGNLASAKLTMVVHSDVFVFETNEINLTVKLKTQDDKGNVIWVPVPLGRFYVFEVTSTKLSKTIIAYDDLYKKEMEEQYASSLTYPVRAYEMLDELCGILDISYHPSMENELINRPPLVSEIIQREDGKLEVVESDSDQVCLGMTVGQALGYLASYFGGNFMIDGDRKLKLIKYPEEVTKTYDYTKFCEQTIGLSSYKITGLNCNIYEGNTINVGDDNSNYTFTFDNPFMDRPRLENIKNEIESISYKNSHVKLKGDPRLQLGDLIETCEINKYGFAVNQEQIPILRMTFSFTGGCSNIIDSPCKALSEKTINYKGTLSSRLDTLESTVSSTNSELDKINSALTSLSTLKENMDDMHLLVSSMSTEVSSAKYNQYNLLLRQLLRSDITFENKYAAVFNNKYL